MLKEEVSETNRTIFNSFFDSEEDKSEEVFSCFGDAMQGLNVRKFVPV